MFLEKLLRLSGINTNTDGVEKLLFARLFWGALIGAVLALTIKDLPILESWEMASLKWRYQVKKAMGPSINKPGSDNICLVVFDDDAQFEYGVARFNDQEGQYLLAQCITKIESGHPTLVGIDLDLRGASIASLAKVFKRYRNIILSLFGTLEGELPSADLLTHVYAYGYSELPRERDGTVFKLPISDRKPVDSESSRFLVMPSFLEAVVKLFCIQSGLMAQSLIPYLEPDQNAYISYGSKSFETYGFSQVLDPGFNPNCFRNRVVLVGSTLTVRQQEQFLFRNAYGKSLNQFEIQAESVRTLLNERPLLSLSQSVANHVLVLFGSIFGALFSIMSWRRRCLWTFFTAVVVILFSQLCFSAFNTVVPLASTLTILGFDFILATVIFLDTDLRQTNMELALAQQSLQIKAEEERKRIAEDLHDETLPALSSVARMADKLSGQLNDIGGAISGETLDLPKQIRSKLDRAASDMRRVINDLHPSVLETMGFVPAIENLTRTDLKSLNINCTLDNQTDQDDFDFSAFVNLQLYRIVQESLNNIVKHANANEVTITISKANGKLTISVADNGSGIASDLLSGVSGLRIEGEGNSAQKKAVKLSSGKTKLGRGLNNISYRARLIGATVSYRVPSKYQTGTELLLVYPIEAKRILPTS